MDTEDGAMVGAPVDGALGAETQGGSLEVETEGSLALEVETEGVVQDGEYRKCDLSFFVWAFDRNSSRSLVISFPS